MSNEEDSKKLPVKRGTSSSASKRPAAFLAKVRAAKVTKGPRLSTPTRPDPTMVAAALAPRASRPRLVFAIDATRSREPAWQAAQATTDALFETLPGELDVALAVHGSSRVKLFSEFTTDAATLRARAAGLRCEAGTTRLVEIMERCRDSANVKVLVYVGDVFEENVDAATDLAASLRLRGTRVIVLHDRGQAPEWDTSAEAFQLIAKLTRGAVLPFDATATQHLREMLAAVATLAAGGVKLLQARSSQLSAAKLLLESLRKD